MSDLDPKCQLSDSKDCPLASTQPGFQLIKARLATLGADVTIRRVLPHPDRRMIGAWCFWDHFGPIPLTPSSGLNIGPHPHIGLQTLTWLTQGQILHRDSLGSEQLITPGAVNLMTAGNGIAHSEESVAKPGKQLQGVQLWIALPDVNRHDAAQFEHYSSMPTFDFDHLNCTLFAGSALNHTAPTKIYSPLMGLDIKAQQDTEANLPLNPKFEHGLLVVEKSVYAQNQQLEIGTMMYLNPHSTQLHIRAPKGAQFILLGGEPFEEEILVWWNFAARTKAEIEQATMQWLNKTHFGEVKGYQGERLSAPKLA